MSLAVRTKRPGGLREWNYGSFGYVVQGRFASSLGGTGTKYSGDGY
jgi:hypothetical protein